MKREYLLIIIFSLLLISACSNKFESLRYFLDETKLNEYKIVYRETDLGSPDLESSITEFSYKNGNFKYKADFSFDENVETKLSFYKIENKIYSCTEINDKTAENFDIVGCEVFLNETLTEEIANPGFLLEQLELDYENYDIKFTGTKNFAKKKTYCFNGKSEDSTVDICFTRSAIPLYIKEVFKPIELEDGELLDISHELKAIKFEEKVDDSEFILPAEPVERPDIDIINTFDKKAEGITSKDCSLFIMEKRFIDYLYFDFSECSGVSAFDENVDIALSYQNFYNIDKENSKITYIDKHLEEVTLDNCNSSGLASSKSSSISPENNEGTICILTKDNYIIKIGKTSQTDNTITLSWKKLNK